MLLLASQCANVAVPEASELAMRYYQSGNILWIIGWIWALLVPCLFLFTPLSLRLSSLAQRFTKNWYFSICIYLVLFLAIFLALYFPLDFYADYVREHAYGLSTQSFGRWIGNWGKSALILLIASLAFVWIFYWLMRKSPKRWWLFATFASIAISFFGLFIQPLFIDPLFNDFGPMKDKVLERQILDLAARAGIKEGRVFEVDKSQDTTRENAYVNGIGPSMQIVLWDTLIKKETPRQVLFVMGHEMGHYVLHHMWWSLLYFSLTSFILFYFLFKAGTRLAPKFHIPHLSDIASFPLLLLLVNLFSFATLPLNNYFSRTLEHNADTFGIEITQDNQAAGESFAQIVNSDLINPRPGPLYVFFRATHPPVGERIDFFNTYCPWTEGKPLKYGRFFQEESP